MKSTTSWNGAVLSIVVTAITSLVVATHDTSVKQMSLEELAGLRVGDTWNECCQPQLKEKCENSNLLKCATNPTCDSNGVIYTNCPDSVCNPSFPEDRCVSFSRDADNVSVCYMTGNTIDCGGGKSRCEFTPGSHWDIYMRCTSGGAICIWAGDICV